MWLICIFQGFNYSSVKTISYGLSNKLKLDLTQYYKLKLNWSFAIPTFCFYFQLFYSASILKWFCACIWDVNRAYTLIPGSSHILTPTSLLDDIKALSKGPIEPLTIDDRSNAWEILASSKHLCKLPLLSYSSYHSAQCTQLNFLNGKLKGTYLILTFMF